MAHELAWYAMTAYNTPAQYGFGTAEEAQEWARRISADLDVNACGWERVTDPARIARLESGDEGVFLDVELAPPCA